MYHYYGLSLPFILLYLFGFQVSILHYVMEMLLIMNTYKLVKEEMWVLIKYQFLRQR